MEISPALVLAVVAALAALAVGALDLTHEMTLGIDLGTTYSVAATCDERPRSATEPSSSSVTAETRPSSPPPPP